MPATSKAQRKFFGWAEHNPSAAKSEGKYPTGMSKQSMHDFSSTPEKGLPEYAADGIPFNGGYRYLGHDADGNGPTHIHPSGHSFEGVFHRFAKTTDSPMQEDGSTGVKHWIQGAVKRPSFREGALTKKAHAAGQSPMAFAHSHEHAPGLTGQQARFAINAQK